MSSLCKIISKCVRSSSGLCWMPAKGQGGAHDKICSEWRSIFEYKAPSDTMIAGSQHFSPHHVITFKCTGAFSHQLADDREHHRASLGMAPCSFHPPLPHLLTLPSPSSVTARILFDLFLRASLCVTGNI